MIDSKCCLNCQERHYKCHSECERYKEYRKNLDEINAQIRKDKANDAFIYNLAMRTVRKAEKKSKLKGKSKIR